MNYLYFLVFAVILLISNNLSGQVEESQLSPYILNERTPEYALLYDSMQKINSNQQKFIKDIVAKIDSDESQHRDLNFYTLALLNMPGDDVINILLDRIDVLKKYGGPPSAKDVYRASKGLEPRQVYPIYETLLNRTNSNVQKRVNRYILHSDVLLGKLSDKQIYLISRFFRAIPSDLEILNSIKNENVNWNTNVSAINRGAY